MFKRVFICLLFLFTLINSQNIEVLSMKEKEEEKTVLEFTLDSLAKDKDLKVDLRRFLIHGTTYMANARITYYSNDKIATLPATISVPNGKYSFNADNGKLYGKTNMTIDAEGGYQKWKIIPGDYKEAKRKRKISLYGNLLFGGIGVGLALSGHIRQIIYSVKIKDIEWDMEGSQETIDWYIDAGSKWVDKLEKEQEEYRELEKNKKEYEDKKKSITPFLISGYSTLSLGLTIGIPNLIGAHKKGMKSELLASSAQVPQETMELQGVKQ